MSSNHERIILIADPEILAIPIVENNEPFIDLKTQSIIACGPSPEIPNNNDYTKMRKSVYEKLLKAQSLLPQGLYFCLYEAYRSLELQTKLFDERYHHIQTKYPNWNRKEIFQETIQLVSPITNLDGSPNIPPHSTGGAIDVYLIDDQKNAIEMGMHPKEWMGDLDGRLSKTHHACISLEAQHNRDIMSSALEKAGFVNYPTEYWHWSFGDRYWAYHTQQPAALYGSFKQNA